MSVGAQVASIYAVNGGYTDELSVKDISDFEMYMQNALHTYHSDLEDVLSKDWNEEIEGKLKDFLTTVKTDYLAKTK